MLLRSTAMICHFLRGKLNSYNFLCFLLLTKLEFASIISHTAHCTSSIINAQTKITLPFFFKWILDRLPSIIYVDHLMCCYPVDC